MNKQGTLALVVVALALIGLGGCSGTSNDLANQPADKPTILVDVVALGITGELWEELFLYDDTLTQGQLDARALRLERLLMTPNPEEIKEYILQTRITTFDGEPATVAVQDKGGKRTAQCLVTPTIVEGEGVRVAVEITYNDKTTFVRYRDPDTKQEKPLPYLFPMEINMNQKSPCAIHGTAHDPGIILPDEKPVILGGQCVADSQNIAGIYHIVLIRAEVVPAKTVPAEIASAGNRQE